MKKIILSAFVLSLAVAVQAQDKPQRDHHRTPMMEGKRHHGGMMDMKALNLTEDQKTQFKTQNESFRKKMEELKKNDNITVKDWKSKAENLRKEHKSKIDGILTSEQKAQLEKRKAEGKQRHEAMGKERADRMKTELGLSDEQSAKMKANREAMGAKMKAIRENKSLGEEQKREQMKELMKSQKDNMKSILTEEQMKKFKESRQHRPQGERKRPEGNRSSI